MTSKESRHVRRMEIQIEELKTALKRSQSVWVTQFHEVYESRTALLQAFELMEEAQEVIRRVIEDDPQFMAR